jgi:ribonuclease HII
MRNLILPRSLDEHASLQMIAGVDEAGRGPLAGDVVAAAVILDPALEIPGLTDSKKLSAVQREKLFPLIKQQALSFAIASASVEEIDSLNILQASMLAMKRAVAALTLTAELVYVDGNRCPVWEYHSQAVVKGDSKIASIAAASILAKVTRDQELQKLDEQYPGYGFARHKGYPTKFHLEALKILGPSPVHRKSFGPVAQLLK